MHIRRTLAIGALSAVALGGMVAAPANADDHLTCENVDAAIVDAQTAKTDAWQAFRTYKHTPKGKLVKAERAEARVEARQARRELRALAKEMSKADRREFRALAKEVRAESRQLAKANRQLRSNKAVMVEVKAQRRALHRAWADARVELREARQFKAENCPVEEEPVTDEESTSDAGDVTAQGKEN